MVSWNWIVSQFAFCLIWVFKTLLTFPDYLAQFLLKFYSQFHFLFILNFVYFYLLVVECIYLGQIYKKNFYITHCKIHLDIFELLSHNYFCIISSSYNINHQIHKSTTNFWQNMQWKTWIRSIFGIFSKYLKTCIRKIGGQFAKIESVIKSVQIRQDNGI